MSCRTWSVWGVTSRGALPATRMCSVNTGGGVQNLNFSRDSAFFKAGVMPHTSRYPALCPRSSWFRIGTMKTSWETAWALVHRARPSKLRPHTVSNSPSCSIVGISVLTSWRGMGGTEPQSNFGTRVLWPRIQNASYQVTLLSTLQAVFALELRPIHFSPLLINDKAASVRCIDNFIYLRTAVAGFKWQLKINMWIITCSLNNFM